MCNSTHAVWLAGQRHGVVRRWRATRRQTGARTGVHRTRPRGHGARNTWWQMAGNCSDSSSLKAQELITAAHPAQLSAVYCLRDPRIESEASIRLVVLRAARTRLLLSYARFGRGE